MKFLIVVDMQNDFISGALGSKLAEAIVPNVTEKVKNYEGTIIFTRDTHFSDYMDTQEGKNLPVKHCIKGTTGWEIAGTFSLGLLAVGSIALGLFAAGAISVGVVSFGALSVGCFSSGALAIGKYVAVGDHAHALIAIGESVAEGSVYSHIGTLSSADMPRIVEWLDANVPSWLGWAKEIFKFYML